jgi:DNA invertase Pin-like site-specific DNA recombinase
MKKKIIAIARVSTRAQFAKGTSVDSQISQIEEYCKMIDAEIVDTIRLQTSGSKMVMQAGMLAKAIELAEKLDAELAVSRLDRVSRNAICLLQLKEASEKRDIHIASLGRSMQSISTIEMQMMAIVADNERRMTQERVKRACRGRVGIIGNGLDAKEVQAKSLAKRRAMTKEWAESVCLRKEVVHAVKMLRTPNLRNVASFLTGRGQLSRTGKPWTSGALAAQLKVLGWRWEELKAS